MGDDYCLIFSWKNIVINYFDLRVDDNLSVNLRHDTVINMVLDTLEFTYHLKNKELIWDNYYYLLADSTLNNTISFREITINNRKYEKVVEIPVPVNIELGDKYSITRIFIDGDEGLVRYDLKNGFKWFRND